MADDISPLARLPGLAPVSADGREVGGLSLEAAATLAARLSLGHPPRAEVLASVGLDDLAFARIEASFMARTGDAALAGDRSMLLRWQAVHDEALAAALAARPLPDVPTWLGIVAALAQGAQPAAVARERGLSVAELARAEVHHARAAEQDFALREQIAAARRG